MVDGDKGVWRELARRVLAGGAPVAVPCQDWVRWCLVAPPVGCRWPSACSVLGSQEAGGSSPGAWVGENAGRGVDLASDGPGNSSSSGACCIPGDIVGQCRWVSMLANCLVHVSHKKRRSHSHTRSDVCLYKQETAYAGSRMLVCNEVSRLFAFDSWVYTKLN
jgi:hypothetical protein